MEIKVGDVVRVDWQDSGCHYNRSDFAPKDCTLMECETFGKVLYITNKRIVIGMDLCAAGRSALNERYKTIARRSVSNIRKFR
jgi:hypothetical protein